jgi:hypothetical protein
LCGERSERHRLGRLCRRLRRRRWGSDVVTIRSSLLGVSSVVLTGYWFAIVGC